MISTAAAGAEAVAVNPSLEPPVELRTEYVQNPLGLEVHEPRLSWQLQSHVRGAHQTAYEILVASSVDALRAGRADVWDSGRVVSDQSIQVPYQGPRLRSRQRCAWMVRVWDAAGQPTAYSEPATWEMGLLEPQDWQAEWIGFPAGWNGRALYFRCDFDVTKPVAFARVFAAGIGYHEVHLNGAKVGDHVLDPGYTDFSKRVLYATHDVTAGLHRGRNTIAAVAGNGWYGMPKLLLQLEVTYRDGTREVVATGRRSDLPAWSVSGGPIIANSIYDGETYDARREKPGWDEPVSQAHEPGVPRTETWSGAMLVNPPGGRLVSQYQEPIKVVDTLACTAVTQPQPGVFVFDTGQNIAGWAELHVRGARGTTVTLRFAEALRPDGTVNQENLRGAAATDTYILRGEGLETWQPTFTYHGFRYVQVEGYPGAPAPDALAIKRVRSAVAPNGRFTCGDELINRIQRMIWNTEANNLYSVPTDCPQRNERMGWMNDLTVRLEESLYNFALPRFYTKFLNDVADAQGADGTITDTVPFIAGHRPADPVDASYVLMGWFLYQYYGDTAAMAAHYDGFKAWVDYLGRRAEDYIVPYGWWGDWSPPAAEAIPGSIGSGALAKNTPLPFMSTGYFYYCADLLAKMGRILHRDADARHYEDLARAIAAAFNRKYWDETTGGYASNNQSCNSFALFLGIVPEQNVPRVVANLVHDVAAHQYHLTTGNLCTKYVMESLAMYGHADVAYRIANQRTYPSWGFMLDNGATTLWERWELLTAGGMNSHDHPMMGSVSAWFYKYLAGIQPDPVVPGFKHFLIVPPVIAALPSASGTYQTMYGPIRSAWRKENRELLLDIHVPVNTTATLHLADALGATVTESGRPVSLRNEGEARLAELVPGDYAFVIR